MAKTKDRAIENLSVTSTLALKTGRYRGLSSNYNRKGHYSALAMAIFYRGGQWTGMQENATSHVLIGIRRLVRADALPANALTKQ